MAEVYFVASVIPIRKAMLKSFETIIGKYIWQGRLLRVALPEMKNQLLNGGLRLPCLETMNQSLMVSQCLRLIRSAGIKSIAHLDFWMGALFQDCAPHLGQGLMAKDTPEYFLKISESVALLMTSDVLTVQSLNRLNNRIIYRSFAEFPPPKIVEKNSMINYKLVWRKLWSVNFSMEETNTLYLLINNKLPIPERLFRIGVKNDPYCSHCPGLEIADIPHLFCSCIRTTDVWLWLRSRILKMFNMNQITDWELLNLVLPAIRKENVVVWVIGVYVNYAWQALMINDDIVKIDKFFGFLTFKYKQMQSSLGFVDWLAL